MEQLQIKKNITGRTFSKMLCVFQSVTSEKMVARLQAAYQAKKSTDPQPPQKNRDPKDKTRAGAYSVWLVEMVRSGIQRQFSHDNNRTVNDAHSGKTAAFKIQFHIESMARSVLTPEKV
eukprot:TRINITY_DN8865_c0_g2_i1.p1 TRINITY_DN8865_c0_g2~~TRINITY_DN8865_c0_g2_i1.p1  ORF type:complete len:119 (-),score=15.46 TRINITY_DN8865_c0_g2_i1:100-456(-)